MARAFAGGGAVLVPNRTIAKVLGVHHDTVDRDIRGNPPLGKNKPNKNNGIDSRSGGFSPGSLSGAAAAKAVESKEIKAERRVAGKESRAAAKLAAPRLQITNRDQRSPSKPVENSTS